MRISAEAVMRQEYMTQSRDVQPEMTHLALNATGTQRQRVTRTVSKSLRQVFAKTQDIRRRQRAKC